MKNEKKTPVHFRQFVLSECERRWSEKNHCTWEEAPYEWKRRYYTDMYAGLWRDQAVLSLDAKGVIMPAEYELTAWEDMFPPRKSNESKKVESLNELYERDGLHYWSNVMGEINLPGSESFTKVNAESLPPDARFLFETYQTDNIGANVYVVSIENRFGMGIVFPLDLRTETPRHCLKGSEGAYQMSEVSPGIAQWIAERAPDGVEVYFGADTDPCGHEIMVFIPTGRCDELLGAGCQKAAPLVEKAWKHIYKEFQISEESNSADVCERRKFGKENHTMSKVKSLNELYSRDGMHYWCNATADINLPGDDTFVIRKVKDLPDDVRPLYETYQTENLAVNVYVVSIEGHSGMALVFLLDHEMETEMHGLTGDEGADLLRKEAPAIAEWIAERAPDVVEIFFGEDTDPCGHEILVFIPAEQCEELLGTECAKAGPLAGKAWEHIYKVLHMS